MNELRSNTATGRVVAADGSVRIVKGAKHLGSAYLDDEGCWWVHWWILNNRLSGRTASLVSELRAIRNATTKHDQVVTVLTDCRSAVDLIHAWQAGKSKAIPGYQGATLTNFARRVQSHPELFDVQWVNGHAGHPLNEGADTLARLASRVHRDNLKPRDVHARAAGVAEAFAQQFREAA